MAGLRNALLLEDKPTRKGPPTPKGFDNDDEFLADMRRSYEWGVQHNEHNVRAGKDDAKFAAGNQWDPQVKQRREGEKKPTLTFNRLVAFIAQIVGNRLMNETEIRCYPDNGGTKEAAAIREGIIRSIFQNSSANFARDEATKYQVVGGEGSFQLKIDYAANDVFEQDISIQAISDPYSAVYDPLSVEPSGADAEFAFVGDDIPHREFKKRWPWATQTSFEHDGTWNRSGLWMTEDNVRVISYWRMVTDGTKTLCLYQDGTVHDITDMEEYEYQQFAETNDDGSYYTREVNDRFAQLYICSGNQILEGPYNYKISSIPVYRVPGWELNDGDRVHRWGLVRFLKDPQRLHNYWRSTVAEQLVAAPRNKWLTTKAAVQGYETKWRNAPTASDPFLYYNDGEEKPTHIPPPGIDAALINEAGLATQDLKDISNIHEANLGMPSNEVSGVAITRRQQVSDVGTYIYTDRLRNADERCAKNCNELIPYIYDTKRMTLVTGRDSKPQMQWINDPAKPNSDVTIGKYGMVVSTGPATETKRTLAADQMTAFVNAAPESAGLVMDLIAEAQDWPMSDKFAARFRMGLKPGMIPQDEMTPEQIQMQQQQAQAAEQAQQIAQLQAQAEIQLTTNRALSEQAKAAQLQASAYKAVIDAHARMDDVSGKNQEREFKGIMQAVDQHNTIGKEDREHHLEVHKTAHAMASTDVDKLHSTVGLHHTQQGLNIQQQQADTADTVAQQPDDTGGEAAQ